MFYVFLKNILIRRKENNITKKLKVTSHYRFRSKIKIFNFMFNIEQNHFNYNMYIQKTIFLISSRLHRRILLTKGLRILDMQFLLNNFQI